LTCKCRFLRPEDSGEPENVPDEIEVIDAAGEDEG